MQRLDVDLNRSIDGTEKPVTVFVLFGFLALVLGVLLYITDRSPEHIYFLNESFSLYVNGQQVFGVIGNSLPSFVHVFAFILFSLSILSGNRRNLYTVCVVWFVMDIAFEISQHPVVSAELLPLIPEWFQQVPILDNVSSYLKYGTFDVLDVLAIALGTISAFTVVVVFFMNKIEMKNDNSQEN